MIKDVQKQVNLCLTMLENIDRAVKELHELKIDNHYFWFRLKKDVFKAPHDEDVYYPELESAAKKHLDRHAFDCFFSDVKKRIEAFFDHEDDWLQRPNVIYPKLTNSDVASMQIRHLMYHVGRLNKVLQDELGQATPWIDYFGT